MAKYKLEAILDLGELDDLLEMVNRKILTHTCMARLDLLSKRITLKEFKWHEGYAKYLKSLREKLKYTRIEKPKKKKRNK